MGAPGKLSKDRLGYSLPVDAPLYQRLPIYYKHVSMLLFDYVTDAEDAANLLPTALELVDPPTVTLVFAEYPWSTLGPYNEVAQALKCTYRGQPVYYRLQGPTLVIEFLQAPDSSVASGKPSVNHIHTWWRVLPAATGAKG